MKKPTIVWGVGSVLVVLSLALAWNVWRTPPDFTDALAEVERRLGRRLVPARLTGVEHAPYPVRRGSPDEPGVKDEIEPQDLLALGTAVRALETSGSGLRARVGQALLEIAAGGSEADLTAAIEQLEAAAGGRFDDPELLNDLAALNLTRALEHGQPQDLLAAFDQADRALELRPDLASARFNRALALDELSLTPLAVSAWEEYLELDPRSGWAAEAGQRLDQLRLREPLTHWKERRDEWERLALAGDRAGLQELFSPFRAEALRYLERDLTAAWLAALDRDPGEAERLLAIGREVAAALTSLTHDPYPVEVMAAIDVPATVVAGAPDRRAVVDALGKYFDARSLLEEQGLDAARGPFEAARRQLLAAGSPLYLRAIYDLAVAERRRQRYPQTLALLGEITADERARSYPVLWGETHWMIALGFAETGHPERALDAGRESLAAFEKSGDPDRYAGIRIMISGILDALGRSREAWHHRSGALRLVGALPNPLRAYQAYGEAAVAAWKEGYPATAVAFENLAVDAGRELEDPLAEIDALIWRGRMQLRNGDVDDARESLAMARAGQARLRDEELGRRTAASLLTAESELLIETDPAAAVERLDQVVEFYGGGYRYPLAEALVTRSLAHLALRDTAAATADLDRCLEVYEETRRGLLSREQRISFFEQAVRVFDRLTALHLEQGDAAAALATTDRRRGRTLLDSFMRTVSSPAPGFAAEPLPAAAIREGLPARTALLEYVRLGDAWWVAVVRRGSLDWVPLPLARADLEARVLELRRAIAAAPGVAEIRAAGEPLYRALISPAEPFLAGASRLVVVPDGVLHALPFDALIDPRRGRALVQRFRISVAASANLHVRSRRRDAELTPAPPLAPLVVGNPSFDRRRFPYGDLRAAEAAARRVAALYGVPEPLIGFAATKARFLELAESAPLIHFGGHAVANHQEPGRSFLLLAPSAGSGDSGALYSQDVYGLRLPVTRLVVLAACGTARGQRLRGEGVFSLAYAFQAAGVPGVVASLWSVDDQGTAELLRRFHEHLAAGASADAALRLAKLSSLELTGEELEPTAEILRRPAVWAAFQVFGQATFHSEGGQENE